MEPNKVIQELMPKLRKYFCQEIIDSIQVKKIGEIWFVFFMIPGRSNGFRFNYFELQYMFSSEENEKTFALVFNKINSDYHYFKNKNYEREMLCVPKYEKIDYVASVIGEVPSALLAKLFVNAWSLATDYSDKVVRKILKNLSPKDFYENYKENEKKVVDALPEKVRVYRGFSYSKMNLKGWSWSLSKDIAFRFTWDLVRKGSGDVVSCEVPKKHLIVYINDRSEHEVVINPINIKWKKLEIVMKNVQFEPSKDGMADIPVESFLNLNP